MKIRITGNEDDFGKLLPVLTKHKSEFDSFRKPQKGNNPRYKEGGDKYNPKEGEQLLMYLEISVDDFLWLLKK